MLTKVSRRKSRPNPLWIDPVSSRKNFRRNSALGDDPCSDLGLLARCPTLQGHSSVLSFSAASRSGCKSTFGHFCRVRGGKACLNLLPEPAGESYLRTKTGQPGPTPSSWAAFPQTTAISNQSEEPSRATNCPGGARP